MVYYVTQEMELCFFPGFAVSESYVKYDQMPNHDLCGIKLNFTVNRLSLNLLISFKCFCNLLHLFYISIEGHCRRIRARSCFFCSQLLWLQNWPKASKMVFSPSPANGLIQSSMARIQSCLFCSNNFLKAAYSASAKLWRPSCQSWWQRVLHIPSLSFISLAAPASAWRLIGDFVSASCSILLLVTYFTFKKRAQDGQ